MITTGFLLLCATAAAGQTVIGTVTDEEGSPVVGAFVTLLVDDTGERANAVLTDETGRYAMRVPAPGRYRLRVESIGFETVASGPVLLEPEETVRRDLTMGRTAIALEGIEAEGEARCRVRPAEGLAVARVWEEARKVLAVAGWTDGEGAYRFRTVRYERVLDPETGRVREEERRTRTGFFRQPFTSRSAERLAAEGYLEASDTATFLIAPDARVLLSDAFLDTHCFQLAGGAEDDTTGMIGLVFRPVDGRELPEIRGTLWVDRETAALSHLEYRYVNLPFGVPTARLGGRVDFRRLPNGAWIVGRWTLRTPVVGIEPGGGRTRRVLAAIKEYGGEAIDIESPGGETVMARTGAVLTGTVHDSMRGGPLAGAQVFLSGTSYAATTNADGRFGMRGLPDGRYAVGFSHARLDSLGILPPWVEVELVEGDSASVALAVPSEATFLAAACAEVVDTANAAAEITTPGLAALHRGTAVIAGRVREAGSGVPLPNARVAITWTRWQTRLERDAVREEGRTLEIRPDRSGRFVACGLPEDVTIRVRATALERASDTLSFRLEGGEVRSVDLRIGLTDAASVVGTVLDQETAAPVPEARVRLARRDGPAYARRADAAGRVRFDEVAAGVYALSVERAGYADRTDSITIERGRRYEVEVGLAPEVIGLEPIEVTVLSAEEGARRAEANSQVVRLSRTQLRTYGERGALNVAEALRMHDPAAIRVRPAAGALNPAGLCVEAARARGRPAADRGRGCKMLAVYVDGVRVPAEDIGLMLDGLAPEDVASVELLPPSEATFRYGTVAGDGALVITTGGRSGTKR